jgi:hypothetical protein
VETVWQFASAATFGHIQLISQVISARQVKKSIYGQWYPLQRKSSRPHEYFVKRTVSISWRVIFIHSVNHDSKVMFSMMLLLRISWNTEQRIVVDVGCIWVRGQVKTIRKPFGPRIRFFSLSCKPIHPYRCKPQRSFYEWLKEGSPQHAEQSPYQVQTS